jgi:hypothetical protein
MTVEAVWRLQSEVLIKKCRSYQSTAINWQIMMQIMDIINTNLGTVPIYVEILGKNLSEGDWFARMSCLIIIDAIFKRAKPPQLAALQCPELFRALSQPAICDNPDLHTFLYKSVPHWVSSCDAQSCVSPSLSDFEATVCGYRFAPKLTAPLIEKLTNEMQTAAEITKLLAQALLANGSNLSNPLIDELTTNVHEIAQRTGVLVPQLIDRDLHEFSDAEHELAILCLKFINELRTGSSEITAEHLVVAMTRVNKAAAKQQKVKEKRKEREERPARRRRKATDWMAEDEFFRRFDDMKTAERADDSDKGHVVDSFIEI